MIAKNKLDTWIDQNENITVEKTKLNLLMGNLRFEKAKFKDDLNTTDTCTIELAQIAGFSIYDFLTKDEINIKEIALNDANLFLTSSPKKDSTNKAKRLFLISELKTDNVNINYSTEKFNIQVKQGNLYLTDISNPNKLQFGDIKLSVKDFSYKPKVGIHNLLARAIELDNVENQISINNFKIEPVCSKEKWPSCFPNKKSRVSYSVENITGKLDTTPLLSGIFLEELEVDKGLFTVLTYQEMEPIESPKDFFMKEFDKVGIPIDIPTIKVKDNTIHALLKGENIDTISFDKVYATLINVTNIPEKLRENDFVKVATLSKFMGADLKVDFDFKINDPLNAYAFKLELDPMPFTNLNKALHYNTQLVIEEGQLHQLDCQVSGNNLTSQGKCEMAYEDLYASIENNSGVTKKLFTKVLNLIVKDGTSKSDSIESKTFSSTLERDDNKDFFYHAYTLILQVIRKVMLPI